MVEMETEAARNAAWPRLMAVTGVAQVTDIDCISRATLDFWLLPVEQTWEYQQKNRPKKVSSYNAIRRHHRQRQQPGLFKD